MSNLSPNPGAKKRRDAVLSFLILSVFALASFGTALVLGTEPRVVFERTGEHTFRVTGSNHFAGFQFYSKTIEGVESVNMTSASRNDRRDSIEERNRRAARKRLDFTAANGAVLSWGRTDDSRRIDDFMRSKEPTLALNDPPPWWRAALSWAAVGFGALIFIAAIQSFFPKKTDPSARR